VNLETVRIITPRATITAKALVTPRIRPFLIDGKTVHHVGMPWHWGYKGISRATWSTTSRPLGRRPQRRHPRGLSVCLPGGTIVRARLMLARVRASRGPARANCLSGTLTQPRCTTIGFSYTSPRNSGLEWDILGHSWVVARAQATDLWVRRADRTSTGCSGRADRAHYPYCDFATWPSM